MSEWYVYILECEDGSLYTGITTNPKRRLEAHKKGKASNYTAARGVVGIAYTESVTDRSAASKREAAIKSMRREQKMGLIERC